jgi:hypothetical protein
MTSIKKAQDNESCGRLLTIWKWKGWQTMYLFNRFSACELSHQTWASPFRLYIIYIDSRLNGENEQNKKAWKLSFFANSSSTVKKSGNGWALLQSPNSSVSSLIGHYIVFPSVKHEPKNAVHAYIAYTVGLNTGSQDVSETRPLSDPIKKKNKALRTTQQSCVPGRPLKAFPVTCGSLSFHTTPLPL